MILKHSKDSEGFGKWRLFSSSPLDFTSAWKKKKLIQDTVPAISLLSLFVTKHEKTRESVAKFENYRGVIFAWELIWRITELQHTPELSWTQKRCQSLNSAQSQRYLRAQWQMSVFFGHNGKCLCSLDTMANVCVPLRGSCFLFTYLLHKHNTYGSFGFWHTLLRYNEGNVTARI